VPYPCRSPSSIFSPTVAPERPRRHTCASLARLRRPYQLEPTRARPLNHRQDQRSSRPNSRQRSDVSSPDTEAKFVSANPSGCPAFGTRQSSADRDQQTTFPPAVCTVANPLVHATAQRVVEAFAEENDLLLRHAGVIQIEGSCPFRGLLGVPRYGLHTALSPYSVTRYPKIQPLRHLHDCSGCFRLERSPGGICTHWKAPSCHGARQADPANNVGAQY
jgi:hypothetical protein